MAKCLGRRDCAASGGPQCGAECTRGTGHFFCSGLRHEREPHGRGAELSAVRGRLEGASVMVNQPEYPCGYQLFTYYGDDGRHTTICLTYPEDGTPPLSLVELRERITLELEKARQATGPSVRFLEEY